MTAEADMWAAAVEQAFRAGCASRIPGVRVDYSGASALEAANEWRFLTATHGPWAESRSRICNMCGVDPDVARQEALRRGPSRLALDGLRAEKNRHEARGADRKHREVFGINPRPSTMERNARLTEDYSAGVPMAALCAKYGLSESRVCNIANTLGVRRPDWFRVEAGKLGPVVRDRNKAAASAVEAGGSVSRAGGGGVGVAASFHGETMEEATR